MGKRFSKVDRAFITTSESQIDACYWEHVFDNPKSSMSVVEHEGWNFVRVTERTRLNEDNSAIMRQIYSMAIIKLMNLIGLIFVPGQSQLVGYKVDAVFIRRGRKLTLGSKYRLEDWKPPKFKEMPEEEHNIATEYARKEWMLLDKPIKDSMCMTGKPGDGKSYTARKYLCPRTLALAFTNKACEALRKDGFDNVHTFSSYFHPMRHEIDRSKYDRVVVDEFSMTPWYWVERLVAFKEAEGVIQMYGDPDQCSQVSFRHIDYLGCEVFRWMCDYKLYEAVHVEGTGRYNLALNEFIDELKHTTTVPIWHVNENKTELLVNICKSHRTRNAINKHFSGGKFQTGNPVVSNKNFKKKGIYNSVLYIAEDVGEKHVKIKGHWILKTDIDHGFAVTVYRYQGDTINEPYNIWDVDQMSFNEFYTAVSRGTKLCDVHFPSTVRGKVLRRVSEPIRASVLSWEKVKYGEIYLMENHESQVCYVGMTERTTQERFDEHLKNKEDQIHEHKGEWEVKRVAKVSYFNLETLRTREAQYTIHFRKEHTYTCISKHYKEETFARLPAIKPEPTVQGVTIPGSRFDILDRDSSFVIQFRDKNGDTRKKRRRYKPDNREAKFIEMESVRLQLIEQFA
jgi:ATP:corrinoid adenosyltransferase